MANFGDLVQKAFYLGVGMASYATEKAGDTLQELRAQAQKLADEMVERGEMTTEEAKKFMDDLIEQAQQKSVEEAQSSAKTEPKRIEIVVDDEDDTAQETENLNVLRQQVESLQEELRRLKQD